MKTRTTLILSFTIIITFAAGSAFGKYSGGTGEPNTPYQIATKADLLVLAADANDYSKCFVLTADINMEGQIFTTAIIAPDMNNANYELDGTVFTGTFDGNDHKITHFTINGGSNWYLGLFGYIEFGGSVKNLGLENIAVSGSSLLSEYRGSLVGLNYGSINNCYSMATLSCGGAYIGGLVGDNRGGISNCYSTGTVSGSSNSYCVGGLVGDNFYGSISNCYSTDTVSGWMDVGGLVGANVGSISNCYSTGAVSGLSGSYDSADVGGLVGFSGDGDISDCYSTGDVNGIAYVGGLVGENDQGGSISNCYSTGAVSGTSSVGGLLGAMYNGSVLSSFWDINTSGQTIGVGYGSSMGVSGKTTAEMKTLATFTLAEWDFVDTWGIGNGQTYPYLKPLTGFNPADLNYSRTVDFADFAIFATNWLSGE